MYSFLSVLGRKKNNKRANANCKNKYYKSKVTTVTVILLIAGLIMIFISMVYTGIYAAFFLEKLHEAVDHPLKEAIVAAGKGDLDIAGQLLDKRDEAEAKVKAIRSSHSHLALFGLITIAIAAVNQVIALSNTWKIVAAITLIIGGSIFSLGIVLSPFVDETAGKIISVVFGSMVTGSIGIYIWGAAQMFKK